MFNFYILLFEKLKKTNFLLFLFIPFFLEAQNTIGLPNINNFSKSLYKAGLQNWDIKQDNSGIIYIANNEGLLTYDGKKWNLFPLPNKTIVRSLEISDDHKIFVGGQDEIGYFYPNQIGKLEFHSILNLIDKKDRNFGDIWDIKIINNSVYFRTHSKIIRLTKQKTKIYYAPNEWSFLGISNETIFTQDSEKGIYLFEKDILKPISEKNLLPINTEITSILTFSNNIFFTTLKNGIYKYFDSKLEKWNTTSLSQVEKERIYDATILDDKTIAIATSYKGVHILNSNGEIIQSFTKTEGLQNNNVLSIFKDQQKNIWLGLDNGIDCIEFNSAIKRLNPSLESESGYTALLHNNILYTGTSSGLYSVPIQNESDISFSKGNFKLVERAKGQIWSLAEINNLILVGHHEGASIVKNNIAYPINTKTGFWNFIPTSSIYPTDKIITGNYSGLQYFNYSNSTFNSAEQIPEFKESSRFISLDKDNNIWVSHPYHGVFKLIKESNDKYLIKHYTENNGLPSKNNNHLYKIQNEILITTEKGIYLYNSNTDRFIPSEFYKQLIGNLSIRYLKNDTQGNIWFVTEKNIGVIKDPSGKPSIIFFPELNNRILSGFEFIYPINKNNIIIGGENGFFNIDFEKYINNSSAIKVQIRNIFIGDKSDSLIYAGNNLSSSTISKTSNDINNKWNTILFEFATALFGQQVNLEYSYRLVGFIENWSEWSVKTEKEFNNLPTGSYTFEVKARNNLGIESNIEKYSFKILPPWYKTKKAYLTYFILACFLIYYLIKRQNNIYKLQEIKYANEQIALKDVHKRKIKEAESELIAVKNEKLQADIEFKNSELANSAMHLLKKGELLSKIKSEIAHLIKKNSNDKLNADLKKMLKSLQEDEKLDEDWEHFAQHFDNVHSDFLYILKEKYPNITPTELKLSAYLRMNLSTKEIAQLMNISVRGVEIGRYRLRKKLNLDSDVNLVTHMLEI